MTADARKLADKIEQTVKDTQFEPFLSDAEWQEIIAALRSEYVGGEAVPVEDIEAEISHIERNGFTLRTKFPFDYDEGRCRELCAMYLREFIVSWRLKQKLACSDISKGCS